MRCQTYLRFSVLFDKPRQSFRPIQVWVRFTQVTVQSVICSDIQGAPANEPKSQFELRFGSELNAQDLRHLNAAIDGHSTISVLREFLFGNVP